MKQSSRILWTILRALIGVGLLVYLGVSGAIKWSALLGLAFAWKITLLALIILFVDMVVAAWRLRVLLAPRGFHISLNSAVQLTLVGSFFSTFLPGSVGGDFVKIFYATRGHAGRRTEVATILLLDRAVGMFALLVWLLVALPMFPALLHSMPVLYRLMMITAAVAVTMIFGLFLCLSVRVRNSSLLAWLFRKLPGNYLAVMFDTVHAYRNNLGALWSAGGISLIAHTLNVAVALLAALAIAPAAFTLKTSVLMQLGFLINTLPLTPGGLGVGEAAFGALFKGVGLAGGAETLLAWRFLMLLIGLFGLVFYLQGRRQFVYVSDDPSVVGTSTLETQS
jgi:uncharacterized protein (TIRG00374 family)